MGEQTGIEWTDLTWNPWQGCDKVSPGCKFCYMYTEKYRYGQDPTKVVRSAPPTFNLPKSIKRCPPGSLVFTCSWSDWFHEAADAWRAEAWAIIRSRPDVVFQILTKRSDRIKAHLPPDWGDGYPNVWLGVSVESEKYVGRLYDLAHVPAIWTFASFEPLLGPVQIPRNYKACPVCIDADKPGIMDGAPCARCEGTATVTCLSWAIAGGESGPHARPSHPDWHRAIRDECAHQGIPFLFKQWGEWKPSEPEVAPRTFILPDGATLEGVLAGELPEGAVGLSRPGKHAAGRLLDGRLHDGYPPRPTAPPAAGSLL